MNQHTDWHKMWNPRASMSFNSAKGLLNEPGQNNCFLNSAVQVLWHMDAFRRSFRMLSGHACMGNSCIFCALKVIFTQFQYSDQSALPPDALRRALARTFRDQQRFQLNLMDDAAECFENILTRIHCHIANGQSEDMCTAPHCIPHQKFSMTIVEQVICQHCSVSSEPSSFSQTVHYVTASALVAQHNRMSQYMRGPVPDHMFGTILKEACSQGDTRDCPSKCGRRILMNRSLTNCPDVVSIGVIWDSDKPSLDHIKDVVKSVGTIIRLSDLYDRVVDERSRNAELHLVGVVCYYGKHYSTFFFHSKMKTWISFDDATVKEMGSQWCTVADKCCRGHYQPLLLLYSIENAQPIDVTTAPQSTTMLPGYQFGQSDVSIAEEDSRQSSSSADRNLSLGGHSSSAIGGQYNYETSLRNQPQPQVAPSTSYSSTGNHRGRSNTPDPDINHSLPPQRGVPIATGSVSNGGRINSSSAVSTNAPSWGRYQSDDEDDHIEKGIGQLEIVHNRQPSYLTALDTVDSSAHHSHGSGGRTGDEEECTCGVGVGSSHQTLSSGNCKDAVTYSSAASLSSASSSTTTGGYSSAGHYGQNPPPPPQYSQLGRHGHVDLLGSIPVPAYPNGHTQPPSSQSSSQYTQQSYPSNSSSYYNYQAVNQAVNQAVSSSHAYNNPSSAPVSRNNSMRPPMSVDDMIMVHNPSRHHHHLSQVGDPNASNLKRVKSLENSLGGGEPVSSVGGVGGHHRPQSARPSATIGGKSGSALRGWLDEDGDDYGTYINRKSVASVMNKLQQQPGRTNVVKASASNLKVDIPDTSSTGSSSQKESGYRSGGSSVTSSMDSSPTVENTTSYKTLHSSASALSSASAYPLNVLANSKSLSSSVRPLASSNSSMMSSVMSAKPPCTSYAAHPAPHAAAVNSLHQPPHTAAGKQYPHANPPLHANPPPHDRNLPSQRAPPPPLHPSTARGGADLTISSTGGGGEGGATTNKSVKELAKALEKQTPSQQQRPPSPKKALQKSHTTPSSISDDAELQRLCLQAEGLMEGSSQKEAQGDIHMALAKCTQAIGVLQGALCHRGLDEAAGHHLRMKLNAAVLRSRGLYKRINQQDVTSSSSPDTPDTADKISLSSSNSTDTTERFPHNNSRDIISMETTSHNGGGVYSGGFTGRCAPQKHPPGTQPPPPPSKPCVQPKPMVPHTHLTAFDASVTATNKVGMSTRRSFTSDYVSREEYFANHPPPPNKQVPGLMTKMHKSATDSALSSHVYNIEHTCTEAANRPKVPPKPPARTTSMDTKEDEGPKNADGSPIDIYATLPRKGKKRSSTLNGNQQAEVYQAYLDRQKQQQEGEREEPNESGGLVVNHTRQWSKEEIRELLNKDFVQKRRTEESGEQGRALGHRRQSSSDLIDTNNQQYSEQQQQQHQQYSQQQQQQQHNQQHPQSSSYPVQQQQSYQQQIPSQLPPPPAPPSSFAPYPTSTTATVSHQHPQRQFCQPIDTTHPFVTERKVNYNPPPLTGVQTVDIQTPDNVRPSVIDKLDKIYSKQHQQGGGNVVQPLEQQQQQHIPQLAQTGMYPPPPPPLTKHQRKPLSQGHLHMNGTMLPPPPSSSISSRQQTASNHDAMCPQETTIVSKPPSSGEFTTTTTSSSSSSKSPCKTSAHYVSPPMAPPTMGLPMEPPPTLAPPSMPPPQLYMKSQPVIQEDSSTFTDSNYSSNDRTDTQSDTSASTGCHRSIKPAKPALVKKKRLHRVRKNVHFSEQVALISATEEETTQPSEHTDYMKYVSDLLSNSKKAKQKASQQVGGSKESSTLISRAQTPLTVVDDKDSNAKTGYDSDFDENTSDSWSDEVPATDSKVRCNLCRKKLIEVTQMYCSDCTYYMSQFQPTTAAT